MLYLIENYFEMKNILYPINRRLVLLTGIFIFLSLGLYAQNQNMGIGTNTPNPRAVLDIVSPGNNQGILIPRLSASQRQNLSLSNTENGLFVFDTTDGKLYYWFSGAWKEVFGNFAGAQNNQILKFNSTTGRWELSEDIGVIYQAGEGISISSDNIITNTGDTNPDDDITTATEAEGDVEGLFPELNIRVDAVTTVKIAADAVTTAKIADGAITNPKIAVDAIATENIQDEAVSLDKLASNSVNTSKIVDGSVTNEKLANNAVTTEKIANDAITNDKVLNRSLQVQKLAGQFERQNSLLITNSTNNPEWFQPGNDQVIVTTSGGLVFSEPRSNFATNTLPLNNIFIGNAAGFAQPQLVSGDGTLNVGGQLTLTNSPATRTNLGLGSIAVQNADNVSISGGAINATAIGGGTAAAGTFTTLNSNGLSTLNSLTVTGNTNLNGSNFFNGPTSVTGTNTFNTGTGQVTFGGNVNAEQGIDILGGSLTLGGSNFTVNQAGTTNIAGQTFVTNGTNSTSSATGALRVNGGVGIGQNLNVGGIARINGGGTAVDATGPTNGALIVDGGVGIAKSLYVGGTTNTAGIANTGTISTNNLNATGTANIQTLAVNGNTSIVGTLGAGATTLNSLNVTNNATIGGTLGVTGATTLTGLTTTALANLNSLRLGGSGESVSTIRNTVRPTGTADNVSLVTELAVRSAISDIGAENGLTNDGGIIKLGGALTQATTITTTVANTLTISGPGVLTIAGNIIANNGLTISGGPLNITNQAITQTGGGQVTFAGNVDANNGLDVSGANLTVGGGNFSVAPATGNTNIAGNLNVGGITTSNGIENTGAISSTSLSTTGNTSIGGNLQLATGVAVNAIPMMLL